MRPQDRATFRNISLRLREQMGSAAEESGVEFVDFYAASYGHDMCSRNPWIQGRVGNRQGAALHPLAAGQTALAREIEQVLSRPPRSRRSLGPRVLRQRAKLPRLDQAPHVARLRRATPGGLPP